MENAYMTFDGKIRIDNYTIIIALWNAYVEAEGGDKISVNDKEFFENSFENAYDAAMATAIGDWRWTDSFVYVDKDGHIVSFSRFDDERCPIDMDKIDIAYLIRGLQELIQEEEEKSPHKNRYVVNNIPRAIHDALK